MKCRRTEAYSSALNLASERAKRYISEVFEKPAVVRPKAINALERLSGPLPLEGADAVRVIDELDAFGSDATVPSTGGRFFGGVIGGALPASVAAHWLASAWDQNACLYEFSPVAAHLETIALAWTLDLLGLPTSAGAVLVAGTQSAHVTAIAAARHALLWRLGWDVELQGLYGAPEIEVIVGDEAHSTLLKALSILGLGRGRVYRVPADSQGSMIASKIPKMHGPKIICAQVGNVNSGGCDNLRQICEVARDLEAWVHVDGAFGLWAAASPRKRALVEGIAFADSWATDAHKWLNVNYDCGIAIVREKDALARAMSISGAYYPVNNDRFDGMMLGPDSSRRARGIELWATLRSLGRQGVADLIDRTCHYATQFAEKLSAAGLKILNDVVLNQVVARYKSDSVTQQLIDKVTAEGICWIGGTTWRGQTAMRISVSSWATDQSDVDASVESILRAASSL